MAKRKICQAMAVVLALGMCTTGLTGCGNEKRADGKTEIEVVSYKPEAVKAFEKIEKQFNETHDDIHLTISSPNEAMTILKTRFIREDYPDIIAIGGDINYSNFLDADLFEDISDLDVVDTVKRHIWIWTRSLSSFQRMAPMHFLTPQMQQECFTTRICLRRMAGRCLQPGVSLQHCAMR